MALEPKQYRTQRGYFQNSFVDWASVNGYQAFFQPNTVELPEGVTLNEYGWIDCPTSSEIVIPIVSLLPTDRRVLYWFSEKIVCNSPSAVRMSLEGNFNFDESAGDFDPNAWQTTSGYTVSNAKDHTWQGIGMIKTVPGEALRLRVFPGSGNTDDFYFKFIAFDIPL